jgi:hypothetical protein
MIGRCGSALCLSIWLVFLIQLVSGRSLAAKEASADGHNQFGKDLLILLRRSAHQPPRDLHSVIKFVQDSRQVIADEGERIDEWLDRHRPTNTNNAAQHWLRAACSHFRFDGIGGFPSNSFKLTFFDLLRQTNYVTLLASENNGHVAYQSFRQCFKDGNVPLGFGTNIIGALLSLNKHTNEWAGLSESPVVRAAFQLGAVEILADPSIAANEQSYDFLRKYLSLNRLENAVGLAGNDANQSGYQLPVWSVPLSPVQARYTDREILLSIVTNALVGLVSSTNVFPAAFTGFLSDLSANDWFENSSSTFARLVESLSATSRWEFASRLLDQNFATQLIQRPSHLAQLLTNAISHLESRYPHLTNGSLAALRFQTVSSNALLDAEHWSLITNSLSTLSNEVLCGARDFQLTNTISGKLFRYALRQMVLESWRDWPHTEGNPTVASWQWALTLDKLKSNEDARAELIQHFAWAPEFWSTNWNWTEVATAFPPEEQRLHYDLAAVIRYELERLAKPWGAYSIILSTNYTAESTNLAAARIFSILQARQTPRQLDVANGTGHAKLNDKALRAGWSALDKVFSYIHQEDLIIERRGEELTPVSKKFIQEKPLTGEKAATALQALKMPLQSVPAPYAGVISNLLDLTHVRILEDEARSEHIRVGFVHPVFRWNYSNSNTNDRTEGAWRPDDLNGHNPYSQTRDTLGVLSARSNFFATASYATSNAFVLLDQISGPVVLASLSDTLSSTSNLPPFGVGGEDFFRMDYPSKIRVVERQSIDELDRWTTNGYLRYTWVEGESVRPAFAVAIASPLQAIRPDEKYSRAGSAPEAPGIPPVLSLFDQAVALSRMELKERRIALEKRQDAFGFVGPLQHSDGPKDLLERIGKLRASLDDSQFQDVENAQAHLDFAAQSSKTVAADYALMAESGRYAKSVIELEIAKKDLEQSEIQIDINRADAVGHHFLQESSRQNAEAAQAASAQALLKYNEVAYEQFKQRAQLEMLILALPTYIVELERARHQLDLLNNEVLKYHSKIDEARQRYINSKSKDLGGFLKGIAVKLVDAAGAAYGMPGMGSMVNSAFTGIKAASDGDWGAAFSQLSRAAAHGGLNAQEIETQAKKWVSGSGFSEQVFARIAKNPVISELGALAKEYGVDEFGKAQSLCIANRAVRSVFPSVPPLSQPKGKWNDFIAEYRVKLIASGSEAMRDYARSSGRILLASFSNQTNYQEFVRKQPGRANESTPSIARALNQASTNAVRGVQEVLRNHFSNAATPTLRGWKKAEAAFASRMLLDHANRMETNWVPTNPAQSNILATVDDIASATNQNQMIDKMVSAWRQLESYGGSKVETNEAFGDLKKNVERAVREAIQHRDASKLVMDGQSLASVGRSLYESITLDVFDCAVTNKLSVDTNSIAMLFHELQHALTEIEVVAEMSLTVVTALEFVPKQKGFLVETLAGWDEELQSRLDSLTTASGVKTANTIRDYYQNVVNQYRQVDLAGYFSATNLQAYLSPPKVELDEAVQSQLKDFDRNLRSADQVMKSLISNATAKMVKKQIDNIATLESDESYNEGKRKLMEMLGSGIAAAKTSLQNNRVICMSNLEEQPGYAKFESAAKENARRVHRQRLAITDLDQLLVEPPAFANKDVMNMAATLLAWLRKDYPSISTPKRQDHINHQMPKWRQTEADFRDEVSQAGPLQKAYKLRYRWASGVVANLITLTEVTDEEIVASGRNARWSLMEAIFGMDQHGFLAGAKSVVIETNKSQPEMFSAISAIAATNDYWVFFESRSILAGTNHFGLRTDSTNAFNLGTEADVKRQLYQRSSDACKKFKAVAQERVPDTGGLLGSVSRAMSNEWYQLKELTDAEIAQRRTQHITMAAALQAAAETSFRSASDLRANQAKVIREMKLMAVRGMSNLVEVAGNERRRAEQEFEFAAIQRDRARLDSWHAEVTGERLQPNDRVGNDASYHRAIWACFRDFDFMQRYYLGKPESADKTLEDILKAGAIGRRGDLKTKFAEKLLDKLKSDELIGMGSGIPPKGNRITKASYFVFVVSLNNRNWETSWQKTALKMQLKSNNQRQQDYYSIPVELRPIKLGNDDYRMQDEEFTPGVSKATGDYTLLNIDRPSSGTPRILRGPEAGNAQLKTDSRYILGGVFANHANLNPRGDLSDTMFLRCPDVAFFYIGHKPRTGSTEAATPYATRWLQSLKREGGEIQDLGYLELKPNDQNLHKWRNLFATNGGRDLDWRGFTQNAFEIYRLHSLLGRWELLIPSYLIDDNTKDWEIQVVFLGSELQ